MASIGWSPKRIEHEISHSHYDDGRSKGYVGHVNPMDFLHATTRNDAHLKTIFDEAGNLNFKKLTKETQSPFLEFENGKIFGHEGRHRMAALAKNGYTKVPVMVKPYWSSGKNLAPVDQVNFEPQFEGRNPVTINNLIPLNKNYKNQIDDMMAEHPEHFQDGGGITAYHGSPHDFEQFDTSKIGTGEGAQAYGHGLYFAESEPVAKSYSEGLSSKPIISNALQSGQFSDDPSFRAASAVRLNGGEDQALKIMRGNPDTPRNKENISAILDGSYKKHIFPKGHMYEVAIDAHPDHFLDWDKPLSEQSEHVKNAFNERAGLFEHGMPYTGKDLYRIFEDMHGNDSEKASQHLSDHGIHGIKYLDAGSRGSNEQQTRNYVVFDHNRVKVNRKYEQGGRIAYKKGGKVEGAIWHEHDTYESGGNVAPIAKSKLQIHDPAIVEHVLAKVGAVPPALDPSLVAKRGRPL